MAYARTGKGRENRKPQYGKTPEEADRKARALEESLKQLSTPPPPPTWPAGSFSAFVYEIWTPHVYPGLRATTVRSYDSILKHHVLPALGSLQISTIGYSEVKAALDGMQRFDKKGPLPDRRKNECSMRIKEILSLYATLRSAEGGSARTDWKLVKPPRRKRRKERAEPPADFTVRIMAACEGRFAWAKGPVFAGLFLGLRRGEIAGLMWSDIDRVAMTITVSEQRQPEYKEGRVPTKGEERTIPIPPALLEWIDRLGSKNSVFVFLGAKKTPIPVGELSKLTPRLCEKAGLPKIDLHDLRSFAASNLNDMGVELLTIMEILGHTKLDTSLLYLNAKDAKKRKALEGLLKQWTA